MGSCWPHVRTHPASSAEESPSRKLPGPLGFQVKHTQDDAAAFCRKEPRFATGAVGRWAGEARGTKTGRVRAVRRPAL
jgi:hypothetical protein